MRAVILSLFMMAFAAQPGAAVELIMVDQRGCVYCERWEKEIGPIYPKTAEGRFAPLRRIDIRAISDEITLSRRVMFTPTFLVVEEGRELNRLEGYPGQDFFWTLIDDLLHETTDFTGE